MSQMKVRAVVDVTFNKGEVGKAEVSALRDAIGIHDTAAERAEAGRLVWAMDHGMLNVPAGESFATVKASLSAVTRATGAAPALTFQQKFVRTVMAPGVHVTASIPGPSGLGVTTMGIVAGIVTGLLLTPLTVPMGAIIGAMHALRD